MSFLPEQSTLDLEHGYSVWQAPRSAVSLDTMTLPSLPSLDLAGRGLVAQVELEFDSLVAVLPVAVSLLLRHMDLEPCLKWLRSLEAQLKHAMSARSFCLCGTN